MAEIWERLEVKLTAMIHSLSQSGDAPSVHPTLPPLSLLKIIPPPSEPQSLPPPISDASLARPSNISSKVYNDALHPSIPITIAVVYASIAIYINQVNKRRDNKPWSFSKTNLFYGLVLLHNALLAVYSGWTCIGMINAFRHTWPGWEGEHKVARAVDALCKINGPRGFGSAAAFNSADSVWSFTDRMMNLDQGLPDTTDVGRLWNEGLAFYGWLFYLSKFYEVVDTFVILAQGKNTTYFQIWHHAGAMLGAWAGIRYMSPPIWLFVALNSGIHAVMYTYYTLNHLGFQISQKLKSSLTRLQIAQVIFGNLYAMAHLFIAYDIPVETPYLFVHSLSSALPTAASSVSSAFATATASADLASWIKKAALRAAGEEGLAENVRNSQGQTFGIDAIHAAEVEKAQEEIRYKMQYQTVNCLDTSGQVFAILLNFLYLTPLAVMFINWYVGRYLKSAKSSSPPKRIQNLQQSGKGAAKDLKQELADAMSSEQDDLETEKSDIPPQISSKAEKVEKGADQFNEKAREVASDAGNYVKAGASKANDVFQDNLQAATDAASEKVNDLNKQMKGDKHESGAPKESKASKDKPADASKPSSEDKEAKEDLDKAPKLEVPSSSIDSGKKKSQSRSVSPQKKTQLPRPQSKNRQQSPEKKDPSPKQEDKPQTNGDVNAKAETDPKDEKAEDDAKPSSLDESAYEVNPDELVTDEEKKAQAEMQPKSS
ncbi:MAG: hypothetical protein Q9222_005768 [Ikaeria aurantiellina]